MNVFIISQVVIRLQYFQKKMNISIGNQLYLNKFYFRQSGNFPAKTTPLPSGHNTHEPLE
jgi:hypothetical protein